MKYHNKPRKPRRQNPKPYKTFNDTTGNKNDERQARFVFVFKQEADHFEIKAILQTFYFQQMDENKSPRANFKGV